LGRDRWTSGDPVVLQCQLGGELRASIRIRATPMNTHPERRCGTVVSARVTLYEEQPVYTQLLDELSLARDCHHGRAVGAIEYRAVDRSVNIQWRVESMFGGVANTIAARRILQE
jgi:hypothetical protein